MIVVDLEGYSINVPIKEHMHIHEFLEIADRLELLVKKPAPILSPQAPVQPPLQSSYVPPVHHAPTYVPPEQSTSQPPAPTPLPPVQPAFIPPPVPTYVPPEHPVPAYVPSENPVLAASKPLPEPIVPHHMGKPPAYQQHTASQTPVSMINDFSFESENRMQLALKQLQTQVESIKATEHRLDKHEDHIKEILTYLKSLDKHLRK